MAYLCERYLFGRREAEAQAATAGERAWFVCFAIASGVYRLFVLVTLTTFIAGRLFFFGVVLALGAMVAWGLAPVMKGLAYISTSPRLRRVRIRAIAMSLLMAAGLVGVICWLPVPLRSRAEGVVWVPERAMVRASTDGFVERIVVQPGSHVWPGDVLIRCQDPALNTHVKVLELRLQELWMRHTGQWLEDRAQAEILREEIALVEENLARARERLAELTIHSRAEGTLVVPQAQDLPGQFVRQGTQLAYVLDLSTLTVRAVVEQADVDLVQYRTRRVEGRLAERLGMPLAAMVIHEVPAATEQLPSLALGSQGGGSIATDPFDIQRAKAMQKLFQFDLELPASAGVVNVGGRVYIRFDHGWEPLVHRWYQHVRRLFLAKFHA